MNKTLKEILSAQSGQLSSKRVCGVLGWLILLGSFLYATIANVELPVIAEMLVWAIVALLGVDSVAGAFKKNINNPSDEDN